MLQVVINVDVLPPFIIDYGVDAFSNMQVLHYSICCERSFSQVMLVLTYSLG